MNSEERSWPNPEVQDRDPSKIKANGSYLETRTGAIDPKRSVKKQESGHSTPDATRVNSGATPVIKKAGWLDARLYLL